MLSEEKQNNQSEIPAKLDADLIKAIGYEDISPSLLLAQIKIDQPNLSHRLSRFRLYGIVRRTRDNRDKRIYYYTLTAKGLEMLAQLKGRKPPPEKLLSLNEIITGQDKSGVEEKQLFF